MIPKRIFYVWGAREAKRRDVLACMLSWQLNLKDYEIVEINEESNEYFNFQKELKNNKWFREVYNRKMWAHVSDYIRIKVLYEHGGIYFDTDVSVVKSLDPFLSEKAFVGMQNEEYVEPAILGSEPKNELLGDILRGLP